MYHLKLTVLILKSSNSIFKPREIQGAINVAWSLKKTVILKDQIEEFDMASASKCSTEVLKTSKKEIEKNA